jgi:cellulose synthase/poly-beta-1,6-N-acetylglucosamine synthase-like glycosyltransferase
LVAAWDEAEHIAQHIQSFLELRYPNKQLILCAGGGDGTYEAAAAWARESIIVLQQQPGEGKQRALRRCLQHAGGEVIFLTDADCLLDDTAFEQTLFPVVTGQERVSTGSVRPFPNQTNNAFIVAQAAAQLYSDMCGSPYSTGLSGRNASIERKLLQAGGRIRWVPESQLCTEYPVTIGGYIRQQRRWLRNVVVHGWRFGATQEVQASLRTSATGLGMLTLPFGALLWGPLFTVWLLLLAHAFFSRIRYLYFAHIALRTPFGPKQIACQIPLLLLDFIAWSRPLVDYLFTRGRSVW